MKFSNSDIKRFNDKIKAWSWYLMSMWLFIVIVIILAWPYPCYIGRNCTFIGWDEVWEKTSSFFLLFIVLFIAASSVYFYWKLFVFKGSSPPAVRVTECAPKSSEPLSFLASYFVPLVSFSIDKTNHQIVLIILFICIGIMFVRGNLFHLNPTLLLIGFRLYEIKFNYQNTNPEEIPAEDTKIIISKSSISIDDNLRYISISSNLWYAVKI